eukprot:gnl/TRDRNA2_/TRDRNA2_87157_c0_seq1.p1 gnl/TRDRNA2_/TRDRNA2_87157_c0~~gnl/TRDRNA2_/TRDRNA2_87157_c0_seq1.p1  ORF type:complete len:919 (+),score=219.35 gnl/TRDRNA2_/TRDRNA2_87157_c0_seq1:185-2758(+)
MDFCEGGDLEGVLEDAERTRKPLAEDKILAWFAQGMLALKYLHDKHILHRDLKPGNFFITKTGDLKLGDFGIAKALDGKGAYCKEMAGTPYYLAPELVQEKPYSLPADIWSMGVVFFQMCALKVPFDANSMSDLCKKIIKGSIPKVPSRYSDSLRQLCLDMMARDQKQRPSSEDVVKRPVVQSIVRKMLEQKEKAMAAEKDAPPPPKWEILDQFAEFDRNGDGVIDRSELVQVLQHLNSSHWTEDKIDRLLRTCDGNKDGKIQLDEFIQWVFGGEGKRSLAEKALAMMVGAQKAAEEKKLLPLRESMLKWRQAVDFGYFRTSEPDVSITACEGLSWLAENTTTMLQDASKIGQEAARDCLIVVRQMRAISHALETLLAERKRQHVRRVGAVSSQTALRGLCVELLEGTRLGEAPQGLGDEGLKATYVKWEMLQEGEYIVEAAGMGADPSTQEQPIFVRPVAAFVVLNTNFKRKLEFGVRSSGKTPFVFKAPPGEQIEQLVFSGGTCTGIKTAQFNVSWTDDQVNEVRKAFKPCNEAVVKALLSTSYRCGYRQGKHALLQARRSGLDYSFIRSLVPEEIRAEQRKRRLELKAPGHWDLSKMKRDDVVTKGGLDADTQVAIVAVKPNELSALQTMVTDSFSRENLRDAAMSLVPKGLTLVKGVKIQNWQTWSSYVHRIDEIRLDMNQMQKKGLKVFDDVDGLNFNTEKGAQLLDELGYSLDLEANCVWLFHPIDPTPNAKDATVNPEFDVDQAGSEEGKLYGRGIYLTESAARADELSPALADEEACMLVCRVALGNMLSDDAVLPDVGYLFEQCIEGPYHSVLGDRVKRCPNAPREIVVYDKDQVYPEFLLFYKRVYD